MRCFGKFIFLAILATIIAAVVLAKACYGPKEITDRTKQEAEFRELFNTAPTTAVTDIRYHVNDSYFGGCTLWISFTCDDSTYDEVLKANGYKLSTDSMIGWGRTNAPAWWPESDRPQATLYSRNQDDTPANEGFQFMEFLWRDTNSGHVYFTKSYWD